MFKSDSNANLGDLLNALGKTDRLIQPILETWNSAVLPVFSQVLREDKVSTVFPKCVNPHYVIPQVP
nr:hypothetical protein HUO10_004636 [Paraburkholderia busanensis]